jgi:murein L,D-transpeptidase YafK
MFMQCLNPITFIPSIRKIIAMKKITGLSLAAIAFVTNTSFKPNAHYPDEYVIVIDKSDHEMNIFEGEKIVATFDVVFGNDNLGDKMVQGDRKTPEGTFHISYMRKHEKWDRFMLLDYPTKEDIAKFNDRKAKGLIPANAKIGGDIGIHGTWPKEDYAIDRKYNWTLGCVSMKNDDVEDLYNNVVVGTKVIIRR